MDKKKRLILAAVGLIVILAGVGGYAIWSSMNSAPPEETTAAPPIHIVRKPGAPPVMPNGKHVVAGQPAPANGVRRLPGQPVTPGGVNRIGPGAPRPTGAGNNPGMPLGARPGQRHDPFAATQGPRGGARGVLPGLPAAPGTVAPLKPRGPIKIAHRGDPFYLKLNGHEQLPPNVFAVNDGATPTRLFSVAAEPTSAQKQEEVREEPQLRVSGIMTGEGVYAILEKSDGVDIVKPGSQVEIPIPGGQTKRMYRVVSISGTMVKLQSRVNNVTYTQLVPLSDIPLGARPASFGGPPAGGPFGEPPPSGPPPE